MIQKILLLLTVLAYSIIVSQSFMYILSLKYTQLNLGADAYIELRKLIDASMRSNFKYVIYSALLANLLLVLSNIKNPGSLLFIATTIAFVALVADVIITVKGNLPLNDVINNWSSENHPANWQEYRNKWLSIFQYRQMINISGFVSLLIGIVFGSK